MAKLDLSGAFHVVNVRKKDKKRKFLRVKFNGQLYEYNCLPFGLCTAPHVFKKIMKPVYYLLFKKVRNHISGLY